MTTRNIAAIDLGASSGRVMLAVCDSRQDSQQSLQKQTLSLTEVHRFNNYLKSDGNHCYWDLDAIEQHILTGLNKLDEQGVVLDSIGIDTWGVDYVLLDRQGRRVGPCYAYRDSRTEGVMERVCSKLHKDNIYQRTGIQFLPFNTLYQLKALTDAKPDWLNDVADWVMIPDYFIYRLTGQLNREYTNATTTQLVNLQTGGWDKQLLDYLGLPESWFGEIKQPGNKVGVWQSPGGQKIPVIAVASHDTASAVLAAPLENERSAYLCSGTWSLMGLDRRNPCNDQTALAANITNEGGVNGHFRVLKNIMGLWLFQRVCQEQNVTDIAELVSQSSRQTPFQSLINPNDNRFLNPQSMTEEIKQACRDNRQPVPQTTAQLTRCIFDSLALLYKQVIDELATVHGQPIQQLHVVGGGCQNHFLNQLCADVCNLPVSAGPIEASILGNVGCQLMSLGDVGDVNQLRKLVTNSFPVHRFTPRFHPNLEKIRRNFYAPESVNEEIKV